MKKILTLFLTLILILSFQQNSQAYQSKRILTIWAYQDILFRFDYEELDKLLDKYKKNKISRDECVITGIKFLKENESKLSNVEYNIERSMKIKHNSPMKFMAFVYANYTKLSPAALKELQSSLWDLTPYLNRSFTSREIELLTSVEKTISFTVNGKTIKRRDLIDAFQKLADNGYMTKAEAAVHMVLVRNIVFYRPDALPVKYNIIANDFWQDDSNITSWIRENKKEIKADQKAFRAIQMLLSSFNSDLFDYINSMKTGFLMEDSIENEYFKVKQFYPVVSPPNSPPPTVPKYFEEVYKIAEILRNYHEEYKFEDVRRPIAWERGDSDNGKKLYIKIDVINNGAAGNTMLIYDENDYPVSAQITLNGGSMSSSSNGEWLLPTVFHEYFHTCQYSYTAKNTDNNWHSNGDTEEILFGMEGTVTLMTDIAINIHSKENPSYVAPKQFKTPFHAAEFLGCLDSDYMRRTNPYALVTYFYYLLEKKLGIGLYDQNGTMLKPDGNALVMMDSIWKEIEKKQKVFEAIRSYNYYGDNYLNFFHQFNVDNILFNLNLSEATYEGLKAKFVGYIPFPEEKINKIYHANTNTITIGTDSVSFYILLPPNVDPTLDKCTFVSIKGLNVNLQAATAIEIIDKGDKKPSYCLKKLPFINNSFSYELYTQNSYIEKRSQGKFNWTKVIFVFTNASNSSVKANITCKVETVKPDEFLKDYSRPKNLELSKLAGTEYKQMISKLWINWKPVCVEVEKELIKLITLAQSAPLPLTDSSTKAGNPFILKQLIEKYKQLNVTMQEGIVSAHDIRYQFYLRKNYIVSKICEGATSASVLAQLKRLKEYLDDINAVLNNAQNDKIISVIGAMVGDHALTQLTNTKNPMNTPWTDEEDKVNQSINSVKGKIQSVWKKSPYFFNSSDFGNAYTAVGNPAFEIVYQIGKQPAPVNIVPNLKNEPFAKDMVYTISSTVKNFTGVNYKEYLFSDTCDPMDLKYFSVIKKHDYREEFMPPEPGTPGYFKELNEIAYFRLNAHKCKYENIDLMPPDIIAAVSRKYEEFKRRTIDAIIIQFHKGKFDLLNSIKENAASIDARDELLTILTAALEEIKAAEVVNANASNDINRITESIDEITMMLRK